MDNKTLAIILFRVLGVSYLLYGVFYAPYLLFTASFSATFIISSLGVLTYVGAGMCLFLLSKPLAALAVKGLDRNSVSPPPPPPPTFQNS
jgi:hypothetical protein